MTGYKDRFGRPVYGYGFAGQGYCPPHYQEPSCAPFVIKISDIEPGSATTETIKEFGEWGGPIFKATNLIFVGSKSLWIKKESNINGELLSKFDLPCDSYGPGCPTCIDWPAFSNEANNMPLTLHIENKGDIKGDFICRLVGEYVSSTFNVRKSHDYYLAKDPYR